MPPQLVKLIDEYQANLQVATATAEKKAMIDAGVLKAQIAANAHSSKVAEENMNHAIARGKANQDLKQKLIW